MLSRLFVPSALLAITLVACSERSTEQAYDEEEATATGTESAEVVTAPRGLSPDANRNEQKPKEQAEADFESARAVSQPAPPADLADDESDDVIVYGKKTELEFSGVAPAAEPRQTVNLGAAKGRGDYSGTSEGVLGGVVGGQTASADSTSPRSRAVTSGGTPAPGPKTAEKAPSGSTGYYADPTPRPDWTPTVAQNTESFTSYGINDMTLSESDRYSTFSIDVDTASYTIARRKLQEGSLPPAAAVRVEEFVNYFPYDYAGPGAESGSAPFAVHMEAAPNPFDTSHHLLRIGVQGKDLESAGRKPMHLTFLVDTSGSMASADKIGLAKQSLTYLVGNLQSEDTVSIVTYAGSTQVILKPTPLTRKSTILDAIQTLSTGGGTAMGSGMEMAYQMASESAVEGAENRVIVLSDGDANIGRTSHDEILRTVTQYAEEGITLSTIGFGMGNYKDTMMEQLANKGDGNYYYIDSFEESKKVFGKDLAGTLQVIAKDVKIQVEMNPDAVLAWRLVGYENRDIADEDFRNDRVDAGEVGAGHSVTALYDVVLKDGYHAELATVRLRAKKPGADSAAKEWTTTLQSSAVRKDFASASKDFRIAYTAATFAELLRGSPYTAEITYAQLYELGSKANRGKAEDQELLTLIKKAGALSGERGAVSSR